MKKIIPYGKQSISNTEKKLVIKTLFSDFLTQGPLVKKFEALCSNFLNSNFALAFNSASSALYAACRAINLGPDDEVWTSPNSFAATANCVLNCGARLDFIDINNDDYCINVNLLELKLLNKKKKSLKLPKAIILVHFAGFISDLKRIKKLSKIYNFLIIEDASHAFGAKYNNSPIGNCKYSDICVFSFHPVKIITTGEGGLVSTNSKILNYRMKLVRDNGINRDKNSFQNILYKNKPWYYEQLIVGGNFRMSEIHAAIGISQIKKINFFLKKRREIYNLYKKNLLGLPIKFQDIRLKTLPSHHLFIIRVAPSLRDKLFKKLRSKKINVNLHYIPIYRFPFYKKFKFQIKSFPNMENYFKEAISLPIFPNLNKSNQHYVIKIIRDFFKYDIKLC
jgi:UDP-4-amino-4,6-dideoxy-N-acetyl-beta-L-altrosamine transaminase